MIKQMIDKMDVVFNQHLMDITPETQEYFIENGLLAIHYCGDILSGKNRCSINPEDYKARASRVLKRMILYSEKGALAVGYYNELPPNRMIIGLIPPGSRIKSELRDLWVDVDYPDGKTCYKVIQLENYFEIDLTRNRQLESCMPRGNVFVRWKVNEIGRSIKYLYKLHHGLITPRDRIVYDLSYAQLEVLCSEYLRHINEGNRIEYFITPIGRSQKSTDIDGINRHGNVLAQVSFSTDNDEIKEKMAALLRYKDKDTKLLYFGPDSKKELVFDHIQYLPIEHVFNEMKNTLLMEHI